MSWPAPWDELSRRLHDSVAFRAWISRRGGAVRLPLPAAAWVAEVLAAELARPLLVLVPHETDALAWLEATRLVTGEDRAVFFPAPSLSPYQETEAALPVRAQEVLALDRAAAGAASTVVATPRALFRRLPTRDALAAATLAVERGGALELERLIAHLASHGYRRCDLVTEIGDFAVRGGVVDCYAPGEPAPLRLDFVGDEIESIRHFDAESQRSLASLDRARLLPLTLFPEGPEAAARLAARLAPWLGAESGYEAKEHLHSLAAGGRFPGWENFLPLAADETVGLGELLGDALRLSVDPASLATEAAHHAERLAAEQRARLEHQRFALPPEIVERPAAEVAAELARAELTLGPLLGEAGDAVDFQGATTDLFHGQLPRFPREVETARARGERLLLVAPAEHHERLTELLAGREVAVGAGGVELVEGELGRGFRLPAAGVVVFGEPQLLPRPIAETRRRARRRFGPFFGGLRDLKLGDYVVHADHGIGQFVGLRAVGGGDGNAAALPPALRDSAPAAPAEGEVMEIAYAGGKRLLLPLSRLDLVEKYSGIEGIGPRLDQLGGTSWSRTKSRVRNSLRDMAGELVKLYAERQLATAPAMPGDTDLERQFAAAFAWEETADQQEAIAAIAEDLALTRPMDRLLCGDVGFGKTEVAMRAAFRAVDSGYQVAVLAPTTILADQHLETFRERFDGFPVTVEMLSRFRHPLEAKEVKKKAAAGQVDILIGTHRLLSRDITLPRLGLLVVDEEQRFGVAQKERLKQLKKNVHVLAMTATPLPRTLQLSLGGVRDLSVIETPPKDRMAVETAILPRSGEVIVGAIEHELERGGQVYYVFNRVEGIEHMAAELRELLPSLRITIGHGQLPEDELYRRMHAFTRGEFDLLLATTIIENGIDIPNVNTMLVHRADRFGLAQLYQLRGRVGRSNQLGYCYLLVEPDRALTADARQRLEALREFSELGAGFRIAARDLEIRGAGNLLGAEQSGHIGDVGIETYLKLLEEAMRELRGEAVEEAPSVALDLPVPMAIPPDYISEANLRMEIYRKLAAAESSEEELAAELADRFGPPPAAVRTLLAVAAVKRRAEALRVQAISAQGRKLTVRLRRDARVDVERLIRFVAERPSSTFSPAGVLTLELTAGEDPLATVRTLLERLG